MAQSAPPSLAVVDDDPAVLQALTFAFETAGWHVAAFASAEAALSAPNAADWRCLILDQKLPGLSGLDLLERLRARAVVAPALLITTHPSAETRRRALAAGVEIVEKPLLDDALARKVGRVTTQPPI